MTRPTPLVACLVGILVCVVLVVPTAQAAPVGAGTTASARVPTPATRVEMALNARTTNRLLAGSNFVEGRGGARKTRVGREIHLAFDYRRPGRHRGTKALVGRVVFTGDGLDVRWRQLRVDFVRRLITGVGARGNRINLLQLVNLHEPSPGPGYDPDTALILTERGSTLLNRAVSAQDFAPGDLVGTAEGLA